MTNAELIEILSTLDPNEDIVLQVNGISYPLKHVAIDYDIDDLDPVDITVLVAGMG